MKSDYICISTVECNLAALCLRYLTFECFDEEETTPEKLPRSILEGNLSFQDYAVSKWPEHIRSIVKMAPDKFPKDEESEAALGEIQVALEEFASRYEDDIMYASINDMASQDCEPFREYELHYCLTYIWNHIHCHHEKGPQVRNDVSLKALNTSFTRNRKLLEDFYSGKTPVPVGAANNLSEYYGDKLFKCPKITCFYFHEGFSTPRDRQQHVNRHDRPFLCDFPFCGIAEFGFANSKDLEKHRRFFHPETVDHDKIFTQPARQGPVSSRWQCQICGKLFTRSFHMESHVRSHNGERPYTCSECGKAFTRANDCKRHEKIHARRLG